MATSSTIQDQPFRVRSISMPLRPQPLVLRIEEELHKLKSCISPSASFLSAQMMCNGLRGLNILYECIDELLLLQSNQQALSSPHQKKWVEGELGWSVKVLDLCEAIRGNMVAMKDHSQELCLSLRRIDGATESKLQAYTHSEKKAQKEIKYCWRSLKQMEKKCRSTSPQDKDSDLSGVARTLMEARQITVSIFGTILCFSSKLRPNARNSIWSFVPKALTQKKIVCEDKLEHTSEVESLEGLENGLDCLFRRLIQNRVSFLNIISL